MAYRNNVIVDEQRTFPSLLQQATLLALLPSTPTPDHLILLNSLTTNPRESVKAIEPKMNTALATPLGHLVRPEHMLNAKLRFSEQQQKHYHQDCSRLWETIRANPKESTAFKNAHRKLLALTIFLKVRMRVMYNPSNHHRAPPAPQNPMQILMQQVSGARPIPSWADFEAGLSAFHERAQTSMSEDASTLEVPFGSLNVKDRLIEEDVAVALTFLGCDVKSTTADEIEAVWVLLDVQGGSRGELEEYLELACR